MGTIRPLYFVFFSFPTEFGSGCGSLGRAAGFDTRDPWFKSSHQKNIYINHLL